MGSKAVYRNRQILAALLLLRRRPVGVELESGRGDADVTQSMHDA